MFIVALLHIGKNRELDKCSVIFSPHTGAVKIHELTHVVIHVSISINFRNIVLSE